MERIHFDRVPVAAPLYLNPVQLLVAYRAGDQPQAAKFATALTINYSPKVGSDTPGEVIIGATLAPQSKYNDLAAAEPKLILPIWKPGQLHIPLGRLNPVDWSTWETTSLYLSSNAPEDTLYATFTLVAHGRVGQKIVLPEPMPPPPYQSTVDVIPNYQLVGLSYAQRCCNPTGNTGWISSYATLGYTLNVDMINSVVSRDQNVLKCPVSGPVLVTWLGGYQHTTQPYSSATQLKSWSNTSTFALTFQDNFNYGSATAHIPAPPTYFGQTAIYNLPGGAWSAWKPDASGSAAAWNCTFLYLYYASPDLTASNASNYEITPPVEGTGSTINWLKPLNKGSVRNTPITCMRHLLNIPVEAYKPVPGPSGTQPNGLPVWAPRRLLKWRSFLSVVRPRDVKTPAEDELISVEPEEKGE